MSEIRAHDPIEYIADELRQAVAARKCHACGCFQDALAQLGAALPEFPEPDREQLQPLLRQGSQQVVPRKYSCLGCEVCWPANAINAASDCFPGIVAADACPANTPSRGRSWPPLPGNYKVLDAGGDVAVCVLTSESLVDALVAVRPPRVAIVGTLYTENLGIERIITNILANPNLTALVVCGADSRQRIGHRPGQSLLSLMAHGLDERGRIREAEGRRPVLRNLSQGTVDTFRREITVIDRLGEEDPGVLLDLVATPPPTSGSRRTPAPTADLPPVIPAEPPARLALDPMGYFILFPDRSRGTILVEHYGNDGTLAHVFIGRTAQELYATILAREVVSRLDHAAYLGSELARAERSLTTGEPYVQDQAPEPACPAGCGCNTGSTADGV